MASGCRSDWAKPAEDETASRKAVMSTGPLSRFMALLQSLFDD